MILRGHSVISLQSHSVIILQGILFQGQSSGAGGVAGEEFPGQRKCSGGDFGAEEIFRLVTRALSVFRLYICSCIAILFDV